MRVYTFLSLKLQQLLGGFTRPIEAHQKVYEDNTHNFIQQHIERCLMGELTLLKTAIEAAETKKKKLQKKVEKKKLQADAGDAKPDEKK